VALRHEGESVVMEECPVCRKPVAVSNVRRIVFAHRDKAGNPCPMAGLVLPLSIWDEEGETA
jgi:hypothetical protein